MQDFYHKAKPSQALESEPSVDETKSAHRQNDDLHALDRDRTNFFLKYVSSFTALPKSTEPYVTEIQRLLDLNEVELTVWGLLLENLDLLSHNNFHESLGITACLAKEVGNDYDDEAQKRSRSRMEPLLPRIHSLIEVWQKQYPSELTLDLRLVNKTYTQLVERYQALSNLNEAIADDYNLAVEMIDHRRRRGRPLDPELFSCRGQSRFMPECPEITVDNGIVDEYDCIVFEETKSEESSGCVVRTPSFEEEVWEFPMDENMINFDQPVRGIREADFGDSEDLQ
mmetsp:Transcript_38504/g.43722  ORF Transcript_38504/g.43722 Transcript_38504/m.43722 type:complete len:284 (-) Transcript_38504:641-1492(-)|eukprot:CAMPEP_0115005806 /NCGR_PEP_ID=MMETSP0216-20121206/20106_1 /TAXON_ID=223996 /ORGANISM="Protocruzia adherens, Strain Boccale" /LENGTH=283 /DNA_ID=CAMNT_0002372233 /DNA_START=749 /DNA_END=1600 /DNA_ORIENTATION=-